MTPAEAIALLRSAIVAAESLPPDTRILAVEVCISNTTPTAAIHVYDLPPALGPVTERSTVDNGRVLTYRSVWIGDVKIFSVRGGL